MSTKQNHTKRNLVSFTLAFAIALLTLFIQNGNSTQLNHNQLEAKVSTKAPTVSIGNINF